MSLRKAADVAIVATAGLSVGAVAVLLWPILVAGAGVVIFVLVAERVFGAVSDAVARLWPERADDDDEVDETIYG